MALIRAVPLWHTVVYDSGALVGSGNSGILAFSDQISPMWLRNVHYCMSFVAVGTALATNETNDLVMAFYTNAAGDGGAIGTITFNQLTAGSPNDMEAWPGDITTFTIDTPVPPYFKLTWTLAGTTIANSFVLYGNFWRIE